MPLRLVVSKYDGQFSIELCNADTIDEARRFLDSGSDEEYIDLLKFDDPFENEEPMGVLSAFLFHHVAVDGSLGRAMEHVLTQVLRKGMELERKRITERMIGPSESPM